MNIDVSYIRQNKKCYHCDDKHITDTNLFTLLNVYLVFYAKEINIGRPGVFGGEVSPEKGIYGIVIFF